MRAYDQAKASRDPEDFKKLKGMKGWYRCCQYKWGKQREAENWRAIVDGCPKIAKKFKELPDSVRHFLGKQKKFQSRKAQGGSEEEKLQTSILPPEFEDAVSESVAPCLLQKFFAFMHDISPPINTYFT